MSVGPDETRPSRGGPRLADAGRLAAFSDAVFAIVITLLVLDLRVPNFHEGELAASLLEEAPSYLAFVVSFVYIGVLWLNHHALLRMIRGTTLTLNWINLGILFGVVIIPFPTAVLAAALADGDDGDLRVAVVMYALAAALMSAPWLVFFAYLRRHPALHAVEVDRDQVRAQVARPITGLVLYGLTGLLGWVVSPVIGLLGIIVMIIYHGVTSEGLRPGPLRRLRHRGGA
ncbi:TMEM175 family protein [Micromonospora sp. NPDC049559]|uniref:TMEM175 family protein n=1 Tax=Micromonospora sp. NPDC049559 TaxID=3155923 RepID=UPI003440D649